MKTKIRGPLLQKALRIYLMSLLFTGMLIFLPAGSLKFWNGWLFICALFIPMFFVLVNLLLKDPDLLDKRLKIREKDESQRSFLIFSTAVLIITFIIPGLDFQFELSAVPLWVALLSTIAVMTGYVMFFKVMKQNTYVSRVVEIQENQKLIDTGLYSVVRHPMYLAATILYGFSPLVLGSYIALIPMLLMPALLITRIKYEEKVLSEGLAGYKEYMKRVKYRLIPFVW